MKRIALISCLAASLLTGCGQTTTSSPLAGGEDFPNTVSAFGVSTKEAMDSCGSWSALDGIPFSAPSASVESGVIAVAGRFAGRAAAAATVDSTRIDLSDTANGIALLYTLRITDSLIETDTLAVLWNAFAKDAQQGNEQIRWARVRKIERGTGRWMYQVITPAGTDTMVTPLAGKSNRIHLQQVTGWGVRRSVLDMEIDPGPDLSYDTESDSRIFWSRVVQLNNTDTLENVTWQDGDGDSITLDRASGKIGVVSFVRIVPTPVGHPLIQRYVEDGRLRVDPRDSTKSVALRFRRTATWVSGRTISEWIARPGNDSDLVASDTAIFQRLSVHGDDTVHVNFKMRMGTDLAQDTSLRMLSMSVHVHKPSGRTLDLSFAPDAPLKDGDPTRTGSVSMVEFRPGGGRFTVIGRMQDAALTAHVDDGAGLVGTAAWDALGRLLRWVHD
jgi:hypothetical protein